MKRIIIHWTAGEYYPNLHELRCYHFLIDRDGKIHKGVFAPEDNEVCRAGNYAAHTGGGNTASIGVSLCAMYGFKNKNSVGRFPITKVQFEACMKLCAELAIKYRIPISANSVMTHYEFGIKHPDTSSAGKIDIIYIPPYAWVAQSDVGAFIRAKIRWYMSQQVK